MDNPIKFERSKILNNLKEEYAAFPNKYSPDSRKASEMYKYSPVEFGGFISHGPNVSAPSDSTGDDLGTESYANVIRSETQNNFLKAIASGDRREAIRIAIESENKNLGIPINYFNDMLERDKLMRMAYENDNPELAKRAEGESGYQAISRSKMKPSLGPLQKREEGIALTPQNIETVLERQKINR